jgi:nucleoside-diphosphate-sugar epimerase
MKHRKLVVTGGLGFIGSNLVESLALENEVTIIARVTGEYYCKVFLPICCCDDLWNAVQ